MGETELKVKEKTKKVKTVIVKQGEIVVSACKKGWDKVRSTIQKKKEGGN